MARARHHAWPRRCGRGILAAVLASLLSTSAAGTEPMPFPPDVQITLLLKILTYDRSFSVKAKSGVMIGVVFVALALAFFWISTKLPIFVPSPIVHP